MWKRIAVLMVGPLVMSCGTKAIGQTETVTGQVVDLKCYARNKANTGRDHDQGRECALACVKWEGDPVGLIGGDGRYFNWPAGWSPTISAKVVPHLTHTVTITGDVYEKDGTLMIASNDLKMAQGN